MTLATAAELLALALGLLTIAGLLVKASARFTKVEEAVSRSTAEQASLEGKLDKVADSLTAVAINLAQQNQGAEDFGRRFAGIERQLAEQDKRLALEGAGQAQQGAEIRMLRDWRRETELRVASREVPPVVRLEAVPVIVAPEPLGGAEHGES